MLRADDMMYLLEPQIRFLLSRLVRRKSQSKQNGYLERHFEQDIDLFVPAQPIVKARYQEDVSTQMVLVLRFAAIEKDREREWERDRSGRGGARTRT